MEALSRWREHHPARHPLFPPNERWSPRELTKGEPWRHALARSLASLRRGTRDRSFPLACARRAAMLFKGNSSKLELLIEKIQSNKENTSSHDLREALGSEPGSTSSWRSDSSSSSTLEEAPVEGPSAVAATKAAVPAGRASSASSSCSSSASSQPPDGELGFTLGVTETTPYPCQFCAKAFPRLSYLKKHEQCLPPDS
ncbi:Hypothetical predicted protein [Cloeon dipterum]|uniref:C2H2-type domain-containing protein n=1 Tax=Cloeon dipterum TaxID=197152 RepID=A0A8S1DYV9_9INSE|nr:Hypothetical predicted protein [Cloeon dipterum]